jgi:ATP-binding cassette subfamily A (ABC1) protein 3
MSNIDQSCLGLPIVNIVSQLILYSLRCAECSTGVDPVARREIWQLISDMVSKDVPDEEKTSVILTTHSMEECEALCPRISIMANGRLSCLGSAQHLKNKFGQGYQVEMKVNLVAEEEEDYKANAVALTTRVDPTDDAEAPPSDDEFFNLEEALTALRALSGDGYLADLVTAENPIGYNVFKNASSVVGVTLDELAAFATSELRMRNLEKYVEESFPQSILRERQDSKTRYEISAQGVKISTIFASIEENKERLQLSDYGVSQTSLEQVFNMHAAEAEKLKQGRNDC